LVARGDRLLPARGISDFDRGCDGLGIIYWLSDHDRRGPGGLIAHHLGKPRRKSLFLIFLISRPIRGDVAGIADRQKMMRRSVAELIANLEGGALLAGDAIGIDAVDESNLHRVALGDIADHLQADV